MIVALIVYSLISLKKNKTTKLYLSASLAKRTFNFEEYNFSQSTLEQVCKLFSSSSLLARRQAEFLTNANGCTFFLRPAGIYGIRQGAGERGG